MTEKREGSSRAGAVLADLGLGEHVRTGTGRMGTTTVEAVADKPRGVQTVLAALVYGSGTLPQFHRDIPWTSAVIARAEELKEDSWGAGAAAEAVACTVTASIVSSVVVAAAVLPRG